MEKEEVGGGGGREEGESVSVVQLAVLVLRGHRADRGASGQVLRDTESTKNN